MQRRQIIKLLVPLGLAAAGLSVGAVFKKSTCRVLPLSGLREHLKPFADAELAKKIDTAASSEAGHHFDGMCEQGFDDSYRQQVARDFAEGKMKNVDGWFLSETELFTHLVVYQPESLSGARPVGG
jgi:hypothetical protein